MSTDHARLEPIAEGRGVLVRLAGVLDVDAKERTRDTVDAALEQVARTGGDLVLVDLTEVTRLGTLGVAVLLGVQEAAGEIGIELAVIAPADSVAVRELGEGELLDVLPVADTIEQALIALPRNPA